MSRLADYFVVVGFDHEKERSGLSCGRIEQRFPEEDWDDTPFIEGIEAFCQPQGWALGTARRQPAYFVAVLTDIDAQRHYCACLAFHEPVALAPSLGPDEQEEEEEEAGLEGRGGLDGRCPVLVQHHSLMYAPKCLVLVSRLNCITAFKNCLGIIYTVYIDNMPMKIENLVGSILGCVQVPPPGGPQVRFSIGAGDRQALQPPLSPSLPTTGCAVYNLFQHLGIHNVVTLFCAAMTELKILFHSRSYTHLNDACSALTSLMFPFKYSHVYIPLLPASLIEFLSTPTPFIMGVHSSLKCEVVELLDVLLVDLDGGSVIVPECVTVSLLPEPLHTQLYTQLCMVLKPELLSADHAFHPGQSPSSQAAMLDKEIRAIFLRIFAQLFQGYRSCLTVVRIHPKPFITFHRAAFLGQRNFVENEFVTKLLDCMFFNTFVAERGLPYRVCDVFDELYASMNDLLKAEARDPECMLKHIQQLAQQLYINENPNPQPYVEKIPKPTEGAFTRIHQPPFPKLDGDLVKSVMEDGLSKNNLGSKLTTLRPLLPRIVPMGPAAGQIVDNRTVVTNSARRLEVLCNCINYIFDNKISDARKALPAVSRALKNKAARLALTQELQHHVTGNKAVLEHQQFDMVVRLMNCALQDDSSLDEHGVAAAILPLSHAFCRKLCTGVMQFAYTCIQDHVVWSNLQFWEAAFYQDVQRDIRALYLPPQKANTPLMEAPPLVSPPMSPRESKEFPGNWMRPDATRTSADPSSRRSTVLSRPPEPSPLEIAAEQLRMQQSGAIVTDTHTELCSREESTVYSQAIHFANRMAALRVPLDASRRDKSAQDALDSNSNSIITNSVAETDSADGESGFGEEEAWEAVSAVVVKFIGRFVDKVCHESGVTEEHVRALHQMIPGVVTIQQEMLEAVQRESKRLPPMPKPKILVPSLLPGEELVMEGLRAYLIPDGREEGTGSVCGGPALLPAEGAVFITNYRVVFKGMPLDQYACEQTVVRSFPVATLTKEKKIMVQYLQHLEQVLPEGLQLRSNTFQLMKVAFEDEVTSESIEGFRKSLSRVHCPQTIFQLFAFSSHITAPPTPLHKKEKHATLTGKAKRHILKTAMRAGFKPRPSSRKQKYVVQGGAPMSARTLPTGRGGAFDQEGSNRQMALFDDDVSDENEGIALPPPPVTTHLPHRTLEKMSESIYCKDYQRLHLGTPCSSSGGLTGSLSKTRSDGFRISTVNNGYSVCRSYPSLVVVPQSVSDDSVRKLSRCYRHSRFPAVTWRHPSTKALLLRASGFHGKGVMGMLKGHPTSSSTCFRLLRGARACYKAFGRGSPRSLRTASETSASIEQEKLLAAVVRATPLSQQRVPGGGANAGVHDSTLSISSLVLDGAHDNFPTLTPEVSRRSHNPFQKAVNSLRSSGGKSGRQHTDPFQMFMNINRGLMLTQKSRWGSLKDRRHGSTGSLTSEFSLRASRFGDGVDGAHDGVHTLHKVALYVFGEKSQIKGVKAESYPNCDFIPMEYYEARQVKASFKKLMRACCPSASPASPEVSFYKMVEGSEWLNQLQCILQLSGAVVDLMDVQGSSVLLCLEDGWDFTCQVSSVAQLCLDPFYRTWDGFRVLLEKEWLAFGHRFTYRGNQTTAAAATGFAPVFLQFLDVVHQLLHQFPMSFEFNDYYLRFLAYHHVSCRFRTFLLDSECERAEFGWLPTVSSTSSIPVGGSHLRAGGGSGTGLLGTRGGSASLDSGSDDDGVAGSAGTAAARASAAPSFWEYVERLWSKSSVFYNFWYCANLEDEVLRPYSNISNLELWEYYLEETLEQGPSYDFELSSGTLERGTTLKAGLTGFASGVVAPGQRRVLFPYYEDVQSIQVDAFTQLLEGLHDQETELGHLPQKWHVVWNKLEEPSVPDSPVGPPFTLELVRSHARALHKRSTIEFLVRGKIAGGTLDGGMGTGVPAMPTPPQVYPHRFERYNYTTPTNCDFCKSILWGLVKTGMHCVDCGYNCHEKCLPSVPKNCTKYKASICDVGGVSMAISKGSNVESASVSSGITMHTSSQYYDQFSSHCPENRTHEGYLFKRGALLKGWKQRWFVLDSTKHQLRYYDALEDSHCKGLIDLSEVVSVTSAVLIQGAPKKADEKSFFDVKTSKRMYNFMAADASAAQEWIEKIQACLQ
ncbi:myotubularin-related protein 13-like isoform X2 [Ornithodoros turicata]|uniref:myotubularin-related protein 13-like isoform X2 n=1 Tax=Ornithodoros turicata TaxID=34597 RepID=UPI0031395090